MALHHLLHSSSIPKCGVLILSGFGVRVQMQAGHLLLHDGIADERRTIRLSRVSHGLKRLVMVGSDGFITFEAFRWLASQKVSFMVLERDGAPVLNAGPVYPSDARLRRAQALAHHSAQFRRVPGDRRRAARAARDRYRHA